MSDGAARGDQGICVKFRAAVAKARRAGCRAAWRGGTAERLPANIYYFGREARKLWFTTEFMETHPSLTQLLRAATTWAGSRWALAPEAGKADVVLTTRSGAREGALAHGLKRVKTRREFLDAIALVDLDGTGGTV